MHSSRKFPAMRSLLAVSRAIDRFTEKLGELAIWFFLLMLGVGFYNVVARYIGRFIGKQLSSNVSIELQWYLFSILFLLGFSYILKHGENVRVDLLYSRLTEKQQALIDFLGTILFLIPFCLIGLWVTVNPVLQSWGRLPDGSWGTWEVSPDADGLPRAPIKTMIPIGLLFLLLQSLSQAIKYLAVLLDEPQVAEQIRLETSEDIHIE
ncbi:MAG: TRAP transporter small permease subunit [Cyanobacteriota bacterium]|nr:TRAP transporter small permease subunit [Cyanobacteriota bacterium]